MLPSAVHDHVALDYIGLLIPLALASDDSPPSALNDPDCSSSHGEKPLGVMTEVRKCWGLTVNEPQRGQRSMLLHEVFGSLLVSLHYVPDGIHPPGGWPDRGLDTEEQSGSVEHQYSLRSYIDGRDGWWDDRHHSVLVPQRCSSIASDEAYQDAPVRLEVVN